LARYVLAATPLPGHVLPLVHIGAGLAGLGHDIIVLTGTEYADTVTGAGLRFEPLPDDIGIEPPAAPSGLLRMMPTQLRRFALGRAELTSVFADPLVPEWQALRGLLARERVDALLVDVTFTGALALILDGAPRPPVLVCGVGPLTLSSVDTPPFGMAWQPQPGIDYSRMTEVAHRVIMRSSQRTLDKQLRRAGVGPAPVFISDWPRLAEALVQLSVESFEYPRSDLPPAVEFVGPVLAPAAESAPPVPALQCIPKDVAVVHVTQGTFDNADLDQLISPTLQALAERDDVFVIATTGRRGGQRFAGNIPDNAVVTDWVPYAQLMPHVDVMVTNAGYGGVQHALSHGVPLVVAGETSDKAEVAARVSYHRVGIDLGTAMPAPAAVRATVQTVLGDNRFRDAAEVLRRAVAATSPIESIAKALESYATR